MRVAAAAIAFCILTLSSTTARADWFRTLVRYECDVESNMLLVSYVGAYNEEGDRMVSQAGEDAWDPWGLLDIRDDDEGTRVVGTKVVSRTCPLDGCTWHVLISGKPGNADILKRCGSMATARVIVALGDAEVFDSALEGDCHDDEPVIARIEVPPGEPLRVTRVSRSQFYR
ncbi:hypothetical protein [Pseudoxanthomonas mexicana]